MVRKPIRSISCATQRRSFIIVLCLAILFIGSWASFSSTAHAAESLSISSVEQFIVEDFDGDGRLDILASRGQNSYYDTIQIWFQNAPTRTRVIEPFYTDPTLELDPDIEPVWVAMIQTAADLYPDIVYSSMDDDDRGMLVLLHQERADQTIVYNTSALWHSNPSDGEYGRIAVGDLNGDTRTDVAVTVVDGARVDLFYQRANGSFPMEPSARLDTGREPQAVAIADLDDDGTNDLIVAHYIERDIRVWRGSDDWSQSDRTADFTIDYPEKDKNARLTVADLSDDSRPDILFGPYLVYQERDGFPNSYTTIECGPVGYPYDLNGDGRADLVAPAQVRTGYGNKIGFFVQYPNGSLPLEPDYTYTGAAEDIWLGELIPGEEPFLVHVGNGDIELVQPAVGITVSLETVYSSVTEGYDATVRLKVENTGDVDLGTLLVHFTMDDDTSTPVELDCPSPRFSTTKSYDLPTAGHSGSTTISARVYSPRGLLSSNGDGDGDGTGATATTTQEIKASGTTSGGGGSSIVPYYYIFIIAFFALIAVGNLVKKRRQKKERKEREAKQARKHEEERREREAMEAQRARERELEQFRTQLDETAEYIDSFADRIAKASELLEVDTETVRSMHAALDTARRALASEKPQRAWSTIASAEEELTRVREQLMPELSVNLHAGSARSGEWVRMELVLTNTGPATISDIATRPSGSVKVEALDRIERLEIGEQYIDEIGVHSDKPGSVPLIFNITYHRAYDHRAFEAKHEFWLNVTQGLEGVTTINIDRSVKISDSVVHRSRIQT